MFVFYVVVEEVVCWIEKFFLKCVVCFYVLFVIFGCFCFLVEGFGQVGYQCYGVQVECVYYSVDFVEFVVVMFIFGLVYEICLVLLFSGVGQQIVGVYVFELKFWFECFLVCSQLLLVCCVYLVGMSYEDYVWGLFGWLGRISDEIVECIVCYGWIGIGCVIVQLVEIGIGFVGDVFVVVIDEYFGEGCGFD